ncbi:MAG: bifunctional UDP-N-acetylglucosamine diphosphorylase/glucosamine-1-phosphate N-acetyltransferase GlmU [Candidatus Dormibacteria bacterium]
MDHPVSHEPSRDLAVVVLAAGRGQRMRSSLPKVLHPLAGRPMLLYSLDAARAASARPPIVVTSPAQPEVAELARSAGAVVVEQPEPLGTGDAVLRAREAAGDAFFVVVLYGDVPLVSPASLARFLAFRPSSTAALVTVLVDQPSGYGRVLRRHDASLLRIVEEADAIPEEAAIREINTGVCRFHAAALWHRLESVPTSERTGERYLTEVFGLLGPEVALFTAPDALEFAGVNDRAELARAERVIRARINEEVMRSGVTIVDPGSTFLDFGVTVGPDTTIWPFTLLRGRTSVGAGCTLGPYTQLLDTTVGDGARVEAAVVEATEIGPCASVGPYARLRRQTRLAEGAQVGSFAELKATSVGSGSKVPHVSYLGDTTVGDGVNVGAGTITCNFDGHRKHPTTIGDGAFVGSDSVLVAPVKIGPGAYVAAGSVITSDVGAGSLAVGRARQSEIAGWAERRRRRWETEEA